MDDWLIRLLDSLFYRRLKTTLNFVNTLKEKATELGFDACGVAKATALTDQKAVLSEWLDKGYHAGMAYMQNHFEKRIDPRKIVPGAKSVIVVAQNYYHDDFRNPDAFYKVARYAYGKDYHFVIKKKLKHLAEFLTETAGIHTFRIFTDSAPVLERSWAQMAGLGNYGKNTCLIMPRKGSFFFLGELITNLELEPDLPFTKNLCGMCTKCMDACPTNAIIAPGVLNSKKCISYLTIEHKGEMPDAYRGKCEGWVFGCDICQEVCPHNNMPARHHENDFRPLPPIASWNKAEWETMTKEAFNRHFKNSGSPIARVSYDKLMDNIRAAGAANQ